MCGVLNILLFLLKSDHNNLIRHSVLISEKKCNMAEIALIASSSKAKINYLDFFF